MDLHKLCLAIWELHLLFSLIVALFTGMVFGQEYEENQQHHERLETDLSADDIRQKYGADKVVIDLDHIKQDMSAVIQLAADGELTPSEASFYFLRMHDFDDNSKLDGIEIWAALRHSIEHHGDEQDASSSTLETAVDSWLVNYDLNRDGFVDYPEFKQMTKSSTS